MASEADVADLGPAPGQIREVLETSGAILLASGLLAAIGCPICLSNAVVAAGFAAVSVPVIAATSAVERHQQGQVQRALLSGDLPGHIRASLARLRPGSPVHGLQDVQAAELLVMAYGFANAGEHDACFFVDARLRIGSRDDQLLLGPWRRSDDAPAPHCATRAQLAAQDSAQTAHILAESGEILAGMVARRLEESR
jgi:hypothetical protein